jgi:hypothetical protein
MKSAIVAASLVLNPGNRPQPSRTLLGIDAASQLRAFHSDVMVATGGELALELMPVQTAGGEPFVLSQAVAGPDVPMELGTGWMLIREPDGSAVALLVDESTTLRQLEQALEGATTVQAEFSIAFDEAGAHLVGIFDTMGQDAFLGSAPVDYRPAPSVTTGARSMFFERIALLWPKRHFDGPTEQGWVLDGEEQMSSSPGDGLRLTGEDRDDLLNAAITDHGEGWFDFLDLAQPVQTPEGWVIPTVDMEAVVLPEMAYERGQAWGQRSVEWCMPDGAGGWQRASGSLADATEQLGDLSTYGVFTAPVIDL